MTTSPDRLDAFAYRRVGPVALYVGDALQVLAVMPDNSVDTIMTSPATRPHSASPPTRGRCVLGAGQRVLIEASPLDRIWGIGPAAADRAGRPDQRRGLNPLGFALIRARTALGQTDA